MMTKREQELFDALTVMVTAWNHPAVLELRRVKEGYAGLYFPATIKGPIQSTGQAEQIWHKYNGLEKVGLSIADMVKAN